MNLFEMIDTTEARNAALCDVKRVKIQLRLCFVIMQYSL